MTIDIGGYRIYPFFVALVIIITIVLILLIRKIYKLTKIKKEKTNNIITQWQKTKMVDILENEKNVALEETDGYESEYTQIIDNVVSYIKKNNKWNIKELEILDIKTIPIITEILFKEINKCYHIEPKNYNRIVLLVHAIDFINGGPNIKNKMIEWIDSSISIDTIFQYRNKQEGRLKTVMNSSLQKVAVHFDKSINKIPSNLILIDDELKDVNLLDFEDVINEVYTKEAFLTSLRTDTKDVVLLSLLNECQTMVMYMEKPLNNKEKSVFRAIACLCDEQLYSVILDDIAE